MHPIKKKAYKLGVDNVAFLNLNEYHSARSPDPENYLQGAQSLVLYIIRELRGGYMNQSIIRMSSLGALDSAEQNIAYNLAKFIEDKYAVDAIAIPGHRPFEINTETLKSIIAPISLRHSAVQAGLGILGKNGIVVSKKWGSMIRIGGLLTTLNLRSDKPINYDPCSTCEYPCVTMCPARAITREGAKTIIDQAKCTKYSQPYDVGNYMRFMFKFINADKKEQKRMVLTPHWFNLYMAGMGYMYYRCIECSRGCPGTKLKKEYADPAPKRPIATRLADM